jgi:hypothetical protein
MRGVIPTRQEVGNYVNSLIPTTESVRGLRNVLGSELQSVEELSTDSFLYLCCVHGWQEAAGELVSMVKTHTKIAAQMSWNDVLDTIISLKKNVQNATDSLPAEVQRQALERQRVRAKYNSIDLEDPVNRAMAIYEDQFGLDATIVDLVAKQQFVEALHEIPEFDGLLGTAEFNTENGLENIFRKLETIKFDKLPESAALREALLLQRTNFARTGSLDLIKILPDGNLDCWSSTKSTKNSLFSRSYRDG